MAGLRAASCPLAAVLRVRDQRNSMISQQSLGGSVLVVEDDYLIASELKSRLEAAGIKVAGPAPNVERAFEILDTEAELAGAILDIRLGDQFVFPVADELERRGLPFVFSTGYESDVMPERHADKILLRKPIDEDAVIFALVGTVNAVPSNSKLARENGILSRLPLEVVEAMTPNLRSIKLPQGSVIEMPGQTVNRVYFPLNCSISMVMSSGGNARVEIGMIGNEGMTGLGLLHGDEKTPYELVTQIEGSALVIASSDFFDVLQSHPCLRSMSMRFGRSLTIQLSYTALVMAKFDIRQRLARWLVMVDDRVSGRDLHLTHGYLAGSLGVRRPSVTDALHVLEGEKLIRSTRRSIEIRDRGGLIAVAGDCYGPSEAEYLRLMGDRQP